MSIKSGVLYPADQRSILASCFSILYSIPTMKRVLPKIIVILGPTASGKSELAVKLALRLDLKQAQKLYRISGAEIISADSRQVYKGMDIGTGKVPKDKSKIKNQKSKIQSKIQNLYNYRGIRHYLLDIASPKIKFDVVRYKILAEKAIEDILKRGKIPIICGGTGFYIQSIVDNIIFPEVASNPELRKRLENFPIEKLLQMLKKLDSARFKTVDQKNKRRIIRAIEIAKTLGNVPQLKSDAKYDSLQIGIAINRKKLRENIEKRLNKRLRQGMVAEVKKLHQQGVSWKKLIEFGLEYKFIALYLQEKITKEQMISQLKKAIWQYAKRQMTWFKKDKRIKWLAEKNTPTQNEKISQKLINTFLGAEKRDFN